MLDLLSGRKYALFYRLPEEPMNTAHLVLVKSVLEAKDTLASLTTPPQWASLCNDHFLEIRPHTGLV